MATTAKFQGKFMYYENINGKEKKISKEFTDPKKFTDFAKKYPMPTISTMFGLVAPTKSPIKKPLKSSKKANTSSIKKKK